MHAVIKIICFLIFSAAMSAGETSVLLMGLFLLMPLYLFNVGESRGAHLATALVMLKRLRWLFLSIFIIYLFFTPGVLMWPGVLWGPTEEGVLLGLSRIVVLVLIVAAVNVLLSSTEQTEFLAAVHWCLKPLSWFGFPHERLAVRITLTLDAVSAVREAYRHESRMETDVEVQQEKKEVEAHPTGFKLKTIANTAHRLFSKVVADAETASLCEMSLLVQSRPPVIQWSIPLILAATLMTSQLTFEMFRSFTTGWV